jgi:hypothetical protein
MATNVLGTFSKGCEGSVALNFGVSGGASCDNGCVAKQLNDCYAITNENRPDRKQLKNKALRHEATPPGILCGMAQVELQRKLDKGYTLRWFRYSASSTVPQPEEADGLFVTQFRNLTKFVVKQGAGVHLPVESPRKAKFYRDLVGDLVCVRESLQKPGEHLTTQGAVSFIAGREIKTGRNIRDRRIQLARQMARERREATGRNTIVCPAIVSSWQIAAKRWDKARKIHCGHCNACENELVDIVYPHHR